MNMHKETKKDAKSQSKHNCIGVQNQLHVSATYIAIIRLNIEL